ncbi:TetR/AcrR family transcriptional regulator [Acuticoccus kandeliae]|uniref:TetR/AcrR family transcriptional regulator n=1 Tax=Acuticoccus kandeliae TaxID=2073160 RepID=UPI000D3E0555|nr:TetR family transcriptional regulator [Acuticoccus kandeliae]
METRENETPRAPGGRGKRRASQTKGEPKPKRLILEAAETIFAGRGFEQATLREITEEAGVNIAAVNYYFDSKTELIQELLDRRITPFVQARHERLVSLRQATPEGELRLEDVVEALIRPMVELSRDKRGGRSLIRLLLHVRALPTEETTRVFVERVDPVAHEFVDAIMQCGLDISRAEAYWRYNFAIGAAIHVLTDADQSTQRLKRLSGGLCDTDDDEATICELVAFVSAGFRSTIPCPQKEAARRNGRLS